LKIVDQYSYKDGQKFAEKHFQPELDDIRLVLAGVTEKGHRSPSGSGRLLPGALRKSIKQRFIDHGWDRQRVKVEMLNAPKRAVYREIDFVKNRLGVDVQFGRVAMMTYNIASKMPIFRNEDLIDSGVVIVAMKDLAVEMSSGVAYFEQFVWDLEHRGVADVEIPVLVLGVAL
jgi:restriction endonuclease BglII